MGTKLVVRIVTIVLIIGLLFLVARYFYELNDSPDSQQTIDSLKIENEKLHDDLDRLDDTIKKQDQIITRLNKKDSILKDSLNQIQSDYDEIIDKLDGLNANEHYRFFTRYLDSVEI